MLTKILNKQVIAQESNTRVTRFEIHAPLIASKVRPGQFIVIMVREVGEREEGTENEENIGLA